MFPESGKQCILHSNNGNIILGLGSHVTVNPTDHTNKAQLTHYEAIKITDKNHHWVTHIVENK